MNGHLPNQSIHIDKSVTAGDILHLLLWFDGQLDHDPNWGEMQDLAVETHKAALELGLVEGEWVPKVLLPWGFIFREITSKGRLLLQSYYSYRPKRHSSVAFGEAST